MAAAAGAGLAGLSLARRGRGRREANSEISIRNEKLFQEMEILDAANDCGKLYLCQIAATKKEDLIGDHEKELLKALKAPKGQLRFDSASATFEAAIELGSRGKSSELCNKRYFKCVV